MSKRAIDSLERGVNQKPQRITAELLADALKLNESDRRRLLDARRRVSPETSPSLLSQYGAAAPPIGRRREWARIERLFTADAEQALLLTGSPGIGKSHLLREAEALARQVGWSVFTGGSQQSDGQSPYAPLAQALETYLHGLPDETRRQQLEGCEWMARLIPEIMVDERQYGRWPRVEPDAERRFMFAAVRRFVEHVAGTGGALFALDDLQWAAPDALRLLAWLIRATAASAVSGQIRFIVAYRDTVLDSAHPLPQVTSELTHDCLASIARIGPLTLGQSRTLVENALSGKEWPRHDEREGLIEAIVTRAGGVPLFLASYARELQGDGAPRDASSLETYIPADVAQLMRHLISGLPETARHVISVAATIGREAPLSMLGAASDLPEVTVVEAIEAAVAARLMNETADGVSVFAHDLYRDAALANLSVARRSMIHRRVASALEADPFQAQAVTLAYHYGRGGDIAREVVYLERAGDEAFTARAYAAAEHHYRAALSRIESAPGHSTRGRLSEKLGSVLMACGKYGDVIITLEQAAACYRATGDQDGEGRSVAEIGWAHVREGSAARGQSRVESMFAPGALEGVSPATRVSLWRSRAVLLFALNRYEEQLVSARHAVALARENRDDEALAKSLRLEGLALALLERFDEAPAVLDETIALAERLGDLDSLSAALNDTAAAHRCLGQLASSHAYSERSVEVARLLGDPTGIAFLMSSHGDNDFLLGEWPSARRSYEQAVEVAREIGASWVEAYPLTSLGALELAEGRDESGSALLGRARACAERVHDLQALLIVHAACAEHELVHGRASDASSRLEPLLEPPTEQGSVALLPFVAWARLSLGNKRGAASALDRCFERVDANGDQMIAMDAALVRARLSLSDAEWSHAEEILEQAISRSRTMAYPYAEAKARLLLGDALVGRCAFAEARAQYEAARDICDRLGERRYRQQIVDALDRLDTWSLLESGDVRDDTGQGR